MKIIIILLLALVLHPTNITQQPPQAEIPEKYIDLSFYDDLREAQKGFDFDVSVPTYLPIGTEYRDYIISEPMKSIIILYNYDETITRFSQRYKRAGTSYGFSIDPNETETTDIDIIFNNETIKAIRHRHTERLHNIVRWEYNNYDYNLSASLEINEILKSIKSIQNIKDI